MSFNEIAFIFFFFLCIALTWILNSKKIKYRNIFLLIASYIFYGSWDYRFCILLFISTIIDYYYGLRIFKSNNKSTKKRYLYVALFLNVFILFIFKYLNFFVESLTEVLHNMNLGINTVSLNIFLPIGISFYTFQSMSYSIDIYKGKIKPCDNFINFAGFVSFFPQLIAGPIEKANQFLPQFFEKRNLDFNSIINGLRQILWGFFMKLAVADNIAPYVDQVFSNPEQYDSISLFTGALLFSIQLYGDFSGYSHIAIGLAALLGFKLSQNFNYPFFSKSIVEVWRNWHITLISWIGIYIFRPLKYKLKFIKNVVLRDIVSVNILFLITGLWHGPQLTFIVWGLIHATLYIIDSNRRSYFLKNKIIRMLITFVIVSLANVVFRTNSISNLLSYYKALFSFNLDTRGPKILSQTDLSILSFYIFIFFSIEWLRRKYSHPLKNLNWPILLRWPLYLILTLIVIDNFVVRENFIYFQF